MGIIINTTDFVGKYEVAQGSYSGTGLNAYINDNEKTLLIKLLGKELFDLFEADLVNQVPQTQKYIDIYNVLYYTSSLVEITSKGMKDYLLGQIYMIYLRDVSIKNTTSGAVKQQYETSEGLEGQGYLPIIKNNNSIDTGYAIQHYIQLNLTDYPEFNGQELNYTDAVCS